MGPNKSDLRQESNLRNTSPRHQALRRTTALKWLFADLTGKEAFYYGATILGLIGIFVIARNTGLLVQVLLSLLERL